MKNKLILRLVLNVLILILSPIGLYKFCNRFGENWGELVVDTMDTIEKLKD